MSVTSMELGYRPVGFPQELRVSALGDDYVVTIPPKGFLRHPDSGGSLTVHEESGHTVAAFAEVTAWWVERQLEGES